MLNASEDYDGVNDCVEIMNCNKALIAGQHTIPLRPNKDKLQKGFIGYIPSIPAVKMQLIENAVGTKVYGVTNEVLQTVLFSLPPLPEQRRIASALMKVDGLIANLDKLIAKKQAIKKGAMQELLTGKKRLPGFKGEWSITSLEKVCSLTTDTIDTNGIKVNEYVGTENMLSDKKGILPFNGHLTYTYVRKYREDDVLTSNIRPYLKKVWLASRDGGCSSDVLVMHPNENITSKFLYTIISSDKYFAYANDTAIGTKMPRGDKRAIVKYTFPLPPLPEQRAIAHVLSVMDSDISLLEQKREKMKAVKQGMMHDLLTDRIRLTE